MRRPSFTRAASLIVATFAFVAGLMATVQGDVQAQTFTGIRNTKHNLSSNGPSTRNNISNAGEVCVFCHTPHGASTTAAAPLWNRKIDTAQTYQMYDSQSFDAASTIGFISSSVSLACLSCHDGSQAMDTVLNQPGSGWLANGAGSTFTTWSKGTANMTGLAAVAKDGLANDHPVGMQYVKTAAYTLDDDFMAATVRGTSGGNNVWCVPAIQADGSRSSSCDKTSMKLFTRTSTMSGATLAAGQTAAPFVECATCHDPHVEANPTFLRVANTNSAVCLTCHTK